MKKLVGQANHIHMKSGQAVDISTLEVSTFEFEKAPGKFEEVLTISDGNNSFIVNSLEQWKQLDFIVRKEFVHISG